VKILFVGKDIHDPTTRYRVLPLMAELVAAGHQCDLEASRQNPGLLVRARGYDWLFIQRKLFSDWFLRLLVGRRPFVFDFDDAIFVKSDGTASTSRAHRFENTVSRAALTFAGNEYLAAACREVPAVVLPTGVDISRYPGPGDVAGQIGKAPSTTLVWIGSRSTGKYLQGLHDVFRGLAADDLTFRVIADFQYAHPALEVENIPWSGETEVANIASSHIGLAPLVDDPWTRGKCALKILQYMAAGLPVVASDVGANRDVVVHGETGFLVTTVDEWIGAIRELGSEERRQELGAAGRLRVERYYSERVITGRAIRELGAAGLI
jgi:glycosyltransferase involved in cell wall biosynthesis